MSVFTDIARIRATNDNILQELRILNATAAVMAPIVESILDRQSRAADALDKLVLIMTPEPEPEPSPIVGVEMTPGVPTSH